MRERDLKAAGRRYLRSRARRADLFGHDDLDDAAWDMLVDLYVGPMREARSITSTCESSGLPLTTALRRVKGLCDAGLISREPDLFDARRSNVRLTVEGGRRARAWLSLLSTDGWRAD